MAYGKIYDTTDWGNGVCDNSISWGEVYETIADCGKPIVPRYLIAQDGSFLKDEQNNSLIYE